jgi:hypothetical protein
MPPPPPRATPTISPFTGQKRKINPDTMQANKRVCTVSEEFSILKIAVGDEKNIVGAIDITPSSTLSEARMMINDDLDDLEVLL